MPITPLQAAILQSRVEANRKVGTSRRDVHGRPGGASLPSEYDRSAEREMHDTFRNWLNLHSLPFIEAPMHKKSMLPNGWPDFTVFSCGRAIFVEFKTETGSLSHDQEIKIHELECAGFSVLPTKSVADAINFTKLKLLASGS